MKKIYVVILDRYDADENSEIRENLIVTKDYDTSKRYCVGYWEDFKENAPWSCIANENESSWMVRDKNSASYIDISIEEVEFLD